MCAFCLSCPNTTLAALQHDGFVPREWLAANSPMRYCDKFLLGGDKNKGGNTILQLNKENGKTKRNYDTMHACNTYTCKIFVLLN